MSSGISGCHAAAFAANNVGVELLRNGHFTQSLVAFQNAAYLLDPSNKSMATAKFEGPSYSVIHWHSYGRGAPAHASPIVRLLEYNELASMQDFCDTDYNTFAIRIGDTSQEGSKETEFNIASVLYNYGLASMLCYVHLKHERATTSRLHKLLQISKMLFESARTILFNEILSANSVEEDDVDTPALHLANFVFAALTTFYRLQGHSCLPRDLLNAQKIIKTYLYETNCLSEYIRYPQVTANAA